MNKEKQQRLQNRDTKIRSRFQKLRNKRYKDKTQLYSDDTIFQMLSEEFYLSPKTIEAIIFYRTKRKY